MDEKHIDDRAMAWFLNQSTAWRLAFVAGLIDTDGSTSLESFVGPPVLSLRQSVCRTARGHSRILNAFGVVAQSLGFDVRRAEFFELEFLDAPIQRTRDDGQILRREDGALSKAERRANGERYGRMKGAEVTISGDTKRIPLLTPKRLKGTVEYDDSSKCRRGVSSGVYQVTREKPTGGGGVPRRMTSISLQPPVEKNADDADADAAVFALTSGFILLA